MKAKLATALLPALFGLFAAACSGAPEATSGTTDDPLIGGVDAPGASMDAVGTIVRFTRNANGDIQGPYDYGCTASLIGERTVLTAEHCTDGLSGDNYGFAIGADSRAPKRVVPIVGFESETTVPGATQYGGSDIAILHLGEAVKDVRPLAVARLAQEHVGKKLIQVGYGMQNQQNASGTRKAGTATVRGVSGNALEHQFGGFDAWKAEAHNFTDLRMTRAQIDDPVNEPALRAFYARANLAPDHEAALGNAPGDAQACHGDSGGPYLARMDGKLTVLAVTSWGFHSTKLYCYYGVVVSTLGPAASALVTRGLAWVDPCDGITERGACEGDEAVRCASPLEGERRAVRTDCAMLGQACRVGSDRRAACVDSE